MLLIVAIALLFALAYAVLRLSRVSTAATVDVAGAEALIQAQPGLQVLDVRTGMEYGSGHLAAARLIPLHELPSRLAEIDASKPILVYCRSGHRSGIAMQILKKHGFLNAVHLQGGIVAWQSEGKSLSFTQS